ncbi:MAG: CoA ester lyase [Alphaproteobacteria bacterium]|nr:CoA ester lyase [Alphaproteobacteria bacterium]
MFNFNCCRSILFVPGTRPDRFQKAIDSGADAIVIDLEDAVSLKDKDSARNIVVDYFKNNSFENLKIGVFIRINSIRTTPGLKDVLAIIENNLKPDALIIPKTESVGEVEVLDDLFLNRPMSYILLIETAKGLREIYKIVKSSPNIKAINFGGGDFSTDIGATLTWNAMLYTRSEIVAAAATVGIHAFDVPYLNVHDQDNQLLENETAQIKELGFTAKVAIHPKQVASINKIFTPTDIEVQEAQTLLDEMAKSGGNVFEYNGKMVDKPIIKKAEKTIAIYRSANQKNI